MLYQRQHKRHQVVDCTCEECKADSMDIELELETEWGLYPKRCHGKKSPQQLLQERYEAEDPEVGLLGDPSGKFDYYMLYPRKKKIPDALPPDEWGMKPPPQHKPSPPTLQPYYQKALALLNKPQPYKPLYKPSPAPPVECFMFHPESHQYKE